MHIRKFNKVYEGCMKENNFDNVRICLALIVFFSHLAVLTEIPEFSIFEFVFDSNFAVKGFFAISGFLVAKSYLSSKSVFEYAEKRLRRIYPGYIGVVMLCLILGLATTSYNLKDFLTSPETIKYFISNLFFLNFIQPTLPNVFENNPFQAMNGSLWTIKIEVMLYFCIPFIFYLFHRVGSVLSSILIISLSITWSYFFDYIYIGPLGAEIARQFPGQLAFFAFGVLLSVNEKLLTNVRWLALISLGALIFIKNEYARLLVDPIAYTSIVIFLSTMSSVRLKLGKYGDISYGIYLYHFPVIQFLIHFGFFSFNVWVGLVLSLFLTVLFSILSWHFIEKRLLKRSSHYKSSYSYNSRSAS